MLPFTFTACVEEDDCVGCNLNPRIKIEFEALATRDVFDSLLSEANGQISILKDSLSGSISQEDVSKINSLLSLLREDSTKYTEAVSLFRNGRVSIDDISAPGSTGFEQFQDSIFSALYIPVDMENDVSTYYFRFHDIIDTLQLRYQREIVQSLDGVRMRLRKIEVDREITTFDSVRVKCYNVECGNDLTTVYVYF